MPTTSRSSPTTTSAVNEKRRPPLTTLATRLISTTRSWRSRPAGLTERSMDMDMGREGEGSGRGGVYRLDGYAGLTDGLCECLDVTVVLVAAAVVHRGGDARSLGPLGEHLGGLRGALGFGEGAELRLIPADRHDRVAGDVVDHLRPEPAVGAEYRDARPGRRSGDLRADPPAAFEPACLFRKNGHARLLATRPHGPVGQAGQGRTERGVQR